MNDSPLLTLYTLLTSRRLFPPLGLPAPDAGGRPPCPTCRAGPLNTYQDTSTGGEWHACPRDGCFAGGPLELAAARWGLETDVALKRLQALGLLDGAAPTAVADYLAALAARLALADRWGRAGNLYTEGDGSGLWALFLFADPSRDAWDDRCHDLVRIEAAAGKRSRPRALAPLHDLPGRLTALLVVGVGIGGVPRLTYDRGAGDPTAEAPPGVVTASPRGDFAGGDPRLGDWLFAFLDPIGGLRLQLAHLAEHARPLPLVSLTAPPVGSSAPWPLRAGDAPRRLLLWSERRDAPLLRLASDLGARVAPPPTPGHLPVQRASELGGAANLLANLLRRSTGHRETVAAALRAGPPEDAARLAGEMEIPDAEVEQALRDDPSRLIAVMSRRGRVIRFGGADVREDAGGWWLEKTGESISDVAVRVERVLHRPGAGGSAGQTWYCGHLLYRGERVPFTAEARQFERQALRYARQRLLDLGKGLARFKEQWQARAFELALALSPPRAVESFAGYGWEPAGERFLLPGCEIRLGGEARDLDLPAAALGPAAANLGKPVTLSAGEARLLLDHRGAATLWPTLLAVVYNLLAAAYSRPARGLLVLGDGDELVADVAEAAGCPRFHADSPSGLRELQQALAGGVARGGWPASGRGRLARSDLAVRLLESDAACILAPDETAARVAFAGGSWLLLETRGRAPAGAEALRAVSRLVPDLLQYLLVDGLRRGLWGDCLAARSRTGLLGYLAARLGAPADAARPHLGRLLYDGRRAADSLARVLAALADRGRLVLEERGPSPLSADAAGSPVRVLCDRAAGTAVLPLPTLQRALRELHCPRLDEAACAERLRASGHLAGEAGGDVWSLRLGWLERQLKFRLDPRRALRVAT